MLFHAHFFGFYDILASRSPSADQDNSLGQKEFNAILLTVIHLFPNYKGKFEHSNFPDLGEVDFEELEVSFRKDKRKFFHNKNSSKPRYSLKCDSSGAIVYGVSGLPVLLHNLYDRKTGVYLGCKELLSKEMVEVALENLHTTVGIDGKRTCHPMGMARLTTLFNEKYFFKGNTKIIRNFIKNCPTCRVNNPLPATVPPPPKPIRSYRPHSRLQIDLIDMAPRKRQFMSNNKWKFRYILSVKCCFSKFCWLFPLQNKSADCIYSVLYVLFQKEGCPDILQSDNGSEFIADVIGKLCNDFGVRIAHGQPHHLQSHGQIENLYKVT